ncbi:MAG: uroporphyrinogen-III synthase [Bacteroidales bacterium]|nr:uroporphyrinogen-III synthase [Bacteroidales bacterium]MBP3344012.1 uroporphyrinogen-III synthase [Bacteroidales bacterium]MBQ6872534.1 uroporphyrinogen-III synthase [Bacteroidales bacterium]MBQ7999157.1 uroporphyrinogen-III synthase [Bacteroidales bacterium]MBQ8035264.1 uroporphyrinogen-III synthase [Bacteroidales bacterium]
MKVKNILISQPAPQNSSPYSDIIAKFGVNVDFHPFFRVEPLSAKEFRLQKINILDFTAIVFTARTTIDAFFRLCEELRITVPETMKYFCVSEAIALYLQKHIVYRKRKIFFGNGTAASIIESIGQKHKEENFLLATADSNKADLHKLFVKAKLKHDSAVFIKTINSDLSQLDLKKYQIVVFYSPSDVNSLQENFPEFEQKDLMIATFGPATAKAVKAAGLETTIAAPTPEAPSIAKALTLFLEKK